MINFQQDMIERVVEELMSGYTQTYGNLKGEYCTILGWIARLSLENISNTDALYHNVEHTALVALAGQEILKGKHLREGKVQPRDWLQFMIASLCHDIGYVRGICRDDEPERYADGVGGMVELGIKGTDAALTPYHVDRSQCFVRERFLESMIDGEVDLAWICALIEKTRFTNASLQEEEDPFDYPALVRAADFIGQLGDPGYLRKLPALYAEFQEIGANTIMGYDSPAAMRAGYASFFWQMISPKIQGALHYLSISHLGRQWIAGLYAHVFAVEHRARPQPLRNPAGVIFE